MIEELTINCLMIIPFCFLILLCITIIFSFLCDKFEFWEKFLNED